MNQARSDVEPPVAPGAEAAALRQVVLVTGISGSGKSVAVNTMILSLLYKAEARDVRLLMIDPKMLDYILIP